MGLVTNMDGVREHAEGYPVQLWFDDETGRLVFRALNEGRNAETLVDVLDVLEWVQRHPESINGRIVGGGIGFPSARA